MVAFAQDDRIRLADGRVEAVPHSTVLLNPELEGRRAHLWGVFAFDLDTTAGLRTIGPYMAYLSDRDDLWLFGQHEPARFVNEADADACMAQAVELQELALCHLAESGADEGRPFAIGWSSIDRMHEWGFSPIGTSYPITGRRGL